MTGVRIHNARIDGQLDLCDVSANRPFSWAFATLFITGFIGLVRKTT